MKEQNLRRLIAGSILIGIGALSIYRALTDSDPEYMQRRRDRIKRKLLSIKQYQLN